MYTIILFLYPLNFQDEFRFACRKIVGSAFRQYRQSLRRGTPMLRDAGTHSRPIPSISLSTQFHISLLPFALCCLQARPFAKEDSLSLSIEHVGLVVPHSIWFSTRRRWAVMANSRLASSLLYTTVKSSWEQGEFARDDWRQTVF